MKRLSSKAVFNVDRSHILFFVFSAMVLAIIYYYVGHFPIQPPFLWTRSFFVFEVKYGLNGSLCYVPAIYSLAVFRTRNTAIMWFGLILVVMPRIVFFTFTPMYLALNLFFVFCPLILFTIITIELNRRQKERDMLAERDKERQAYVLASINAQENERRRIAQELHDDTIQTLVAAGTGMRSILSNTTVKADEELVKNTQWIRDTIFRTVEDLRRLTLDLRPSILDNMGLLPALRWLADNLGYENHLTTHISVEGQERKIKPENEVILFRIAQEALNNIIRHAQAKEAWVTLEFSDDKLRLNIKDNGCGFLVPDSVAPFTNLGKFGLAGMQQRIRSLNGKLNIESKVGLGTSISADFSLANLVNNH